MQPRTIHLTNPHLWGEVDIRRIEVGLELIGRWIREGRRKAGFTQAHLGRLAGVHQSTISRLENAKLENLALQRLAAIVAALEAAGAIRV
jgi:DNA-binding XRE family transcriptional regulator